jgi:SecD/SecF fusion protein
MKSFFWKFVLCIVPVVLGAWVTYRAWTNYNEGLPGGFKLGVDLVGGTILQYEVDMRKQLQEEKKYDPARDTNLLAEALKRRIDPNDLYNIVIRPAGGEGRVEIILPTGGTTRITKAENAWETLLTKVADQWPDVGRLEIPRGNTTELTKRILQKRDEAVWSKNLLNNEAAWKRVLDNAQEKWLELKYYANDQARLKNLKPGDIQGLEKIILDLPQHGGERQVVEAWVKDQAWKELLYKVLEEWPELQPYREDFLGSDKLEDRNPGIGADQWEALIGRIQARGSVIGLAGLRVMEPLIGEPALSDNMKSKDGKIASGDPSQVESFLNKYFGPSPRQVEKDIEKLTEGGEKGKDLTVEEVQRIKDLVAKVGSLEFRILANSTDDAAGEKDNSDLINSAASNADVKALLEELQTKGLPPPTYREGGLTGPPKQYTIKLPRNTESTVTYSWVELGPQERKSLNLDNAAKNDPARSRNWQEMANKRGQALKLKLPQEGGYYLQGALFYSRESKDINLPEEERQKKKVEYFVLTRDPELDKNGQKSEAITGKFLVNAASTIGNDLRPAVSFVFNSHGGELFREVTRKNVPSGSGPAASQVKRHLAIILDGLIMSAPTINSEISTHGQISGSFTQKEVDGMVNILRSGALPATLKSQPVSESTMGATLGADTIHSGLTAIGYAFLAVIIFMIIYYRFAGLVASVALLANLILTVGFMVFVQATFTLPGLAGIVLTLGMAVDANVLIYERLREERERGASLAVAIRNGYDRALPTIIDTHVSSIFTAVVLYIVGNDQLKGFGVSMTVGLLISLFTSLYMTRVIFDFWLSRHWLTKLKMMRLFAKPDIDFMAIRYYWFTATIILTVVGFTVFIGRLPNDLNIDFVGGTAYGGQLVRPVNIEGLRHLMDEENQKKWLRAEVKELDEKAAKYEVAYTDSDGKKTPPRIITLSSTKVTGDTKQQREEEVRQRAEHLPDWSVELIFPSFDKEEDPSKSKYFNVRTTEREPELVQASLDRLLRDDKGDALLKKIRMESDLTPFTEVEIIRQATQPYREVVGFLANTPQSPFAFLPIANLKTMEHRFDEGIKEIDLKFSEFDEQGKLKPTLASPSFARTLLTRELMDIYQVDDKSKLPFHVDFTGLGKGKEGRFERMRVSFNPGIKLDQVAKVRSAIQKTEQEFEQRPQPDRLENFDSQLAGETRLRAMYAVLASWCAILLYLWFRFGSWTFGMATVLCLIHDLFFTLGIVAFCHYLHGTAIGNLLGIEDFKIDLPAVAALLTLVGYSVSDTIVVFDRIRETRGKNPDLTPDMINDSVNATLSRTLLSSLTVWLVVFVLYVFGGPGVHLFAFVMVVGVVVGTYSSIYIASPLLLIFGEGHRSQFLGPQKGVPVTTTSEEE